MAGLNTTQRPPVIPLTRADLNALGKKAQLVPKQLYFLSDENKLLLAGSRIDYTEFAVGSAGSFSDLLKPLVVAAPIISVVGGGSPTAGCQLSTDDGTFDPNGEPIRNWDKRAVGTLDWFPIGYFGTTITTDPNVAYEYTARVRRISPFANVQSEQARSNIITTVAQPAPVAVDLVIRNMENTRTVGTLRSDQPNKLKVVNRVDGYDTTITGIIGMAAANTDSIANTTYEGTAPEGVQKALISQAKSGSPTRTQPWYFISDKREWTPIFDSYFEGARLIDIDGTSKKMGFLNQSAARANSMLKAVGYEGQDVFRACLFEDGAGSSIDGSANKYRSEIECQERFREGETIYLKMRSKIVGMNFPDLLDTASGAYGIWLQAHHLPPATAQFVQPWLAFIGRKDPANSNARKFYVETRWNDDSGLYNTDVYDIGMKTEAANLRRVIFSAPKTVKNGWLLRNNVSGIIPDGTTIVSGGGDNVSEVIVSQDIPAGTRQVLISPNFHFTSYGPFDLPEGDGDLDVAVKPSLDGTGLIQVKFNDVLIVNISNIKLGYSDDGEKDPDGIQKKKSYYFKPGFYTSPKPMLNTIGGYHQFDFMVSRKPILGLSGRPRDPFDAGPTIGAVTVVAVTAGADPANPKVNDVFKAVVTGRTGTYDNIVYDWHASVDGSIPGSAFGHNRDRFVVTDNCFGKKIFASAASKNKEYVGPRTYSTRSNLVVTDAFIMESFDTGVTGATVTGQADVSTDTVTKVQGVAGVRIQLSGQQLNPKVTMPATHTLDPSTLGVIAWHTKRQSHRAPVSQMLLELMLGSTGYGYNATNGKGTNRSIGVQDYQTDRWDAAPIAEFATAPPAGAAAVGTRISFTTVAANAPYDLDITFDALIGKAGGHPIIGPSFDDAFKTVITNALAAMKPWDMRGTIAVNTNAVVEAGVTSGKYNWGQLADALAAGWDVALDGRRDDGDMTYANSIDEMLFEITEAQRILRARGLDNPGLNYVIYPFGYFSGKNTSLTNTATHVEAQPIQIGAATSDGIDLGNGTSRVTFGAAPATPAAQGMGYYGYKVPKGAKILLVESTTSVIVDKVVPAQTKPAKMIDQSGVFYGYKLIEALKGIGIRMARSTSGGLMHIRFGFGDAGMFLPGQGTSNWNEQSFHDLSTAVQAAGSASFPYFHEGITPGDSNPATGVGGINYNAVGFTNACNSDWGPNHRDGKMSVLAYSEIERYYGSIQFPNLPIAA